MTEKNTSEKAENPRLCSCGGELKLINDYLRDGTLMWQENRCVLCGRTPAQRKIYDLVSEKLATESPTFQRGHCYSCSAGSFQCGEFQPNMSDLDKPFFDPNDRQCVCGHWEHNHERCSVGDPQIKKSEPKMIEDLTKDELSLELYRLLHLCWGQAHESPEYQKNDWVRFSNIIDRVRGWLKKEKPGV